MTTKPASFKEDGSTKKSYERPRLEVYGDIREVTEAFGMLAAADGALMGNTKTS